MASYTHHPSTPSSDATRFKAILESAVDFAVIATDLAARITDWNHGAEFIFGWRADEMLGQEVDRIFTPEDRDEGRPQEEIRLARVNGQANDERWHLKRDGRFWASGRMMQLRDDADRHIGYVKILRDRSDIQIAREQLEAREVYWSGIFDRLVEGMLVGDVVRDGAGRIVDWRYVDVNPAWERMVGVEREAAVGNTLREMIPDIEHEWIDQFGRVVETGVADRFTRQVGVWNRWYEGHAFKLAGDRFGVLFFDVSERMRSERRRDALLELADAFRELTDPAEIAHACARIIGEALGVDRAGYGAFDADAETITIDRDWNVPGVASIAGTHHFRDYGSYVDDLKQGRTIAIKDVEKDARTETFADVLVSIQARSILNIPITEHGRFVALLFLNHATVRDWSPEDLDFVRDAAERTRAAVERRRAEQALSTLAASLESQVEQRTRELMATEEQLRQSQKMEAVGQLTGGLAHDFNNLLTGITGGLDMLRRRIDQGRSDGIERYITAAQGAAERAAALTHRLLAFSRRQTLEPKPTNATALVAGMRDLIDRTVGPEIAVEVRDDPALWPILVDPSQLENALLNLCINARDAMPDGGCIVIETENKHLDEPTADARDLSPGDYVSLAVSDTGSGMPPDVIARVFDPFFTTKPLGMGTGLGLSMIYGFVRQSNGQVRIHSQVGVGTTMRLLLPRHDGAAEAETLEVREKAPRADAGETVLVVDDEPTVRMLIVEVLEDLGYAAIEAEDGAGGLKILRSDARIDLLVTDVGLPGGMNGRQVADAGRMLRPGLKVLFITGYAEAAVLGHGSLDKGMHVMTKPFAMDGLASRIKGLLSA